MNSITEKFLHMISDYKEMWNSSYYIREDGGCAGTQSTKNVSLKPIPGGGGLEIKVEPGTKGEKIYIPACVTHGNMDDIVHNDFYIGEDADVTIVAGCGVHNDDYEDARHNGIHRFFLAKGAKVRYEEKHVGSGETDGKKIIDPVTDVFLEENAVMQMDTIQIGGVDKTIRRTNAELKKGAKLIIHESILTEHEQTAETEFHVDMQEPDSTVDLVSRSVAKDESYQNYHSVIKGNTRCTGHSECDAILMGNGKVNASPELFAGDIDASLIHEAAIGKIAGEQIIKLRTLGLTEEEAEAKIIEGFLTGYQM